MIRQLLTAAALATVFAAAPPLLVAEQLPSPSDRLRPINEKKVSGLFSPTEKGPGLFSREKSPDTFSAGAVVQAAYMQGAGFGMPELGAGPTANPSPPALQGAPVDPPSASPPTYQAPPAGSAAEGAAPATPPGLTPVPRAPAGTLDQPGAGGASPSDLAPVGQPRLDTEWATADNCNLVSPPSGWRAEFGSCGPSYVVPAGAPVYTAPPTIVPATVAPGTVLPGVIVAPTPTAGHRPLFTLGQEYYNVQLGQGIIGQPKAYVPGQSVRNFIRYLTP